MKLVLSAGVIIGVVLWWLSYEVRAPPDSKPAEPANKVAINARAVDP